MTRNTRLAPSARPEPAQTATEASEHAEQAALIERVAWAAGQHPELALLLAIPNGGARHKATAARLKAEGVRAGVPDLFLPVARGGSHGLWIEMKRARGGRVAAAQAWWHVRLAEAGYRVEVCHGQDAAWAALCRYLELPL